MQTNEYVADRFGAAGATLTAVGIVLSGPMGLTVVTLTHPAAPWTSAEVPRSNGLVSYCGRRATSSDGSGIGVFRRQMARIRLTSIHLTTAVGGIECPPHVVDEPVRARSPKQTATGGHRHAG